MCDAPTVARESKILLRVRRAPLRSTRFVLLRFASLASLRFVTHQMLIAIGLLIIGVTALYDLTYYTKTTCRVTGSVDERWCCFESCAATCSYTTAPSCNKMKQEYESRSIHYFVPKEIVCSGGFKCCDHKYDVCHHGNVSYACGMPRCSEFTTSLACTLSCTKCFSASIVLETNGITKQIVRDFGIQLIEAKQFASSKMVECYVRDQYVTIDAYPGITTFFVAFMVLCLWIPPSQ